MKRSSILPVCIVLAAGPTLTVGLGLNAGEGASLLGYFLFGLGMSLAFVGFFANLTND